MFYLNSIWSLDNGLANFKPLKSNIKTDVCVIGGGMAGILTTYLLTKQGVDCVLIEANTIASGVSAYSSAKVTCQHGLIYDKLLTQLGREKAGQYAKANVDALNMYASLIDQEEIACDFERIPTYLYTREDTKPLEKELAAMESLGFSGSLTSQTTLPFEVTGALKMDQQAQFNPLSFLSAISSKLTIYEDTKALEVEGHTVTTNGGHITANHIIVTTHFPFINAPGYYFARMHQERSYVTALKNAGALDGAYLGIDDVSYSFRTYKDMILLGGCGHRTGENPEGGNYSKLTNKALELYPNHQQVCSWATQDCMTHDGIPYIGKYASKIDNLYVATGFNKWGMTSSMASAMILSRMILDGDDEGLDVFSPQRINLMASAKNLALDGAETISGLSRQFFSIPLAELEDVALGHGGIIEHEGEKIGVYKKDKDNIYMVSTKCPHLGCQLAWNPDDLSWDCPCHGSRFDYRGYILNNPAQKGLTHEKSSY